ncbi:MAG: AbrB/MazE/SpoVT family DNA-binding domain-containing protein [Candidatus Hydrothermarchaeales archaeon]
MSAYSKVTRRYQITIPKEMRRILEIKRGDVIAFFAENDKIVLRKVEKIDNPVKFMKGRHKDIELTTKEVEEIATREID